MSGALGPFERELLERLVEATESIAKSLEVRVNGRVITNMPKGSYESGYITPSGQVVPDRLTRGRSPRI